MDRRIVKTRTSLIEAMVRCIQVTNWDDLSIQQICDEADIARSTFYLHFRNMAELLDYGFGHLEDEIVNVPQTRSLDSDKTFGFLPALFQFIASESHAFLFNRPESPAMMQLIGVQLRRAVAVMVKNEIAASTRYRGTSPAMSNFIVGGIYNALENWHMSDDKAPATRIISNLDLSINKLLGP